jgi:sulfite exporter TauE/SafE
VGAHAGSLNALLLGAISIAVVHALIPSHWLAFALVGRAQRWSKARTLEITALAGAGHILTTVALGALVSAAGKAVFKFLPERAEHAITAGFLILLGLYFAYPTLRGKRGCTHHHDHDYGLDRAAEEEQANLDAAKRSSPTVMGALVLGLTLSPCLDLLPIYIAAAPLSWAGVGLICLTMGIVTLGLMLLFVSLALQGLQRLNLGWLERNEGLAVGIILAAIGLLLFVL